VLPEVEIFIGDVPITKYAIPGGKDFADTILPFVHKTNVIILANHGTVSFGETVEKAYWWTEVLDAYCRMLMLARSLGNINYFTEPEAKALLELKGKWGFTDPRLEMKNCDICANDVFRESWKDTGVAPKMFQPPVYSGSEGSKAEPAAVAHSTSPTSSTTATGDQEAIIQAITDKVMMMLSQR
jgi:L-fuculose-phosphate aldolase